MSAKKLACCAVMTALLIAAQYAFSFISGVELVTVLFACFCYVYGVRCGLVTATAFSLLRCLLFGFMPNVVLLYIIYYNLFALVFGLVGRRKPPFWLCPALLILLAAISGFLAATGLPISALLRKRVSVMLWVLCGICFSLLVFYAITASRRNGAGGEVASVAALAAFCTIIFTLLDDVITPLCLGFTKEASAAYFYSGFLAMIPQTVCAAISVSVLFLPLKRAFSAVNGLTKRSENDNIFDTTDES